MKQKLKEFSKNNSLLTNSFNLMVSTGVTALFGFVFWTVVTHTFRSDVVGVATTLLSVSALLSLLGLVGFDTVLIRFLSKSKHRNEQINSSLLVTGIASAIFALLFCLFLPVISPKLKFIDHNIIYVTEFIVFTIFTTWNTLTNAVLIAYRRTSFVVGINIIFSAIKMSLPFLIHSGGPMTIFAFVGIAQAINVALSLAVLIRYFNYSPSPKIHFDIIRKTRRYGLTTYAANVLNLLPDSALPLIIINKLGASAAAYFYVAFTIANLLYTIAFSTTQALLAEAAHDEAHIVMYVRKSLKIVSSLLIPATFLIILLCPLILELFGHSYRNGATNLVRIMSISSLAVMLYAVNITIFKLTHNLNAIIVTAFANASVIMGLSLLLIVNWGLDGVGWAWLIGNIVSVMVGGAYVFGNLHFFQGNETA